MTKLATTMENHQNALPTSSSTNETNPNDRNRAGVKRKAYDTQETEKQIALQRQKSVERLVVLQAERREKDAEEQAALRRQEAIEFQTESEGVRQRWVDAESEAERRSKEFEELMRKILKTGDKSRIIKLSLNECPEEKRAKENNEDETAMLRRHECTYKTRAKETEEQTALRELINAERDAERRELRYKDLVGKILERHDKRRISRRGEEFENDWADRDAMKRAERRAAQAERLANENEEQRALRNLKRAELEAAFEKLFEEGRESQRLRKKELNLAILNEKLKPTTKPILRRRSI